MSEYSTSKSDQSLDDFSTLLEELHTKRNEIARSKDWYKEHARRPMLYFRSVGAVIIVLSVTVPLLTRLEGFWQTLVLPAATLLIAALTGINSFMQWQTQWQGFRQAQFELEYSLSKWDLAMIVAKAHPDKTKASQLAIKATETLIERARKITATETNAFYESVELSDVA